MASSTLNHARQECTCHVHQTLDVGVDHPLPVFQAGALRRFEAELILAVRRALARLSDEQREVVVLKVWGGLTFEEIGEQLSISPNTAASRWRYAMEALRKLITARAHD